VGRLKPNFGFAFAGPTFADIAGDTESGWELSILTEPALQQNKQGGGHPDPEKADVASVACSGMSLDVRNDSARPDGVFVSSAALSMGAPSWVNGGWVVGLYAPHFAAPESTPDGLTHSHYTAWMSQQNIELMGLTVEEALAGQLVMTRTEGDSPILVEATIEERDGGVAISTPDITFSSPEIRVAKAKKDGDKKRKKKKKKGKKKRK
jgi:hypothetical protein